MNKKLVLARDNIIESAGRTTQGFGLGRIVGQLYALLFFSSNPMSLNDMARELKVSKGSVSVNIRELEKWGAVRKIWVKGDRKDFYEAENDILTIFMKGILPVFRKKLNSSLIAADESLEMIKDMELLDAQDEAFAEFYRERLGRIARFQKQVAQFLNLPEA